MNSLWQASRTFMGRKRFWIFGIWYLLLMACFPTYRSGAEQIGIGASLFVAVMFASILASLVALHLRRLLSGPIAHTVPHFVAAHAAVGGAVSLVIWLVVPWITALVKHHSPLYLVSMQAAAGLLLALVL